MPLGFQTDGKTVTATGSRDSLYNNKTIRDKILGKLTHPITTGAALNKESIEEIKDNFLIEKQTEFDELCATYETVIAAPFYDDLMGTVDMPKADIATLTEQSISDYQRTVRAMASRIEQKEQQYKAINKLMYFSLHKDANSWVVTCTKQHLLDAFNVMLPQTFDVDAITNLSKQLTIYIQKSQELNDSMKTIVVADETPETYFDKIEIVAGQDPNILAAAMDKAIRFREGKKEKRRGQIEAFIQPYRGKLRFDENESAFMADGKSVGLYVPLREYGSVEEAKLAVEKRIKQIAPLQERSDVSNVARKTYYLSRLNEATFPFDALFYFAKYHGDGHPVRNAIFHEIDIDVVATTAIETIREWAQAKQLPASIISQPGSYDTWVSHLTPGDSPGNIVIKTRLNDLDAQDGRGFRFPNIAYYRHSGT